MKKKLCTFFGFFLPVVASVMVLGGIHEAKASPFEDGFDTYAGGADIDPISNWNDSAPYTCGNATSTRSNVAPNSYTGAATNNIQACNRIGAAETNGLITFAFFMDSAMPDPGEGDYNGWQIILSGSPNGPVTHFNDAIHIYDERTYHDGDQGNDFCVSHKYDTAGTAYSSVFCGITKNAWHLLTYYYNVDTDTVSFNLDGQMSDPRDMWDDAASSSIDRVDIKIDGSDGKMQRYMFIDTIASSSDYAVWEGVEVVDLPGPGEIYVQTGVANFDFMRVTFCFWDQTNCEIRFDYSYDNIGDTVLLFPEDAPTIYDYVDYIAALPNSAQLSGILSPTIQSADADDTYRIMVIPAGGGTSTLYEMATVHWRASSTDDIVATSFVLTYFKQIFPVSIILQIRDIIKHNLDLANENTKLNITFNDVLPAKYSGLTSSASLLSANLLEDHLPIWNTILYPLFTALCWLVMAIIVFFEVRAVVRKQDV